MQSKQEFHIPISNDGKTAVDWLAEVTGFSKQKIKQCMQKGCVWLERVKTEVSHIDSVEAQLENERGFQQPLQQQTHQGYVQRLRRAKKMLKQNELLHFYYDENVLASEPAAATLIEDFGDYSIWNKPSGMLSQGSKWGDHCTIYRWAEKQLQPERPAFIVHRLDRAANGLIILAHKKTVASQFSKLFEQRQIEKRYQVKTEGDFTTMISSTDGILSINDEIDGKSATSHVSLLSFDEITNTSMLEIQIETGRKHQIRKHLAGLGFPVMGDRLHGSYKNSDHEIDTDLQLQAKFLGFICPITHQERVFTLDS